MRNLLKICFLLSLAACAPIRPAVEPPPANLTIRCLPPALLPEKANMGDLLLADIELAGQYRECARRHDGLVDWAEGVTKPK